MEDRVVYRVGAWGAIIGGALAIVANAFGPRPDSDALGDLRATVDVARSSGRWEITMIGIIVISVLILLALYALTRSVDGTPASGWGRLAWGTAVAGVAVGIAAHAVYASLSRGADAIAPEVLDGVALVADGLFSAWAIVLFGATPVLYGLALRRSVAYPSWLGWGTIGGGIVGLVAGIDHAFGGATSASMVLFGVGAAVFALAVMSTGVVLLRRVSAGAIVSPM